MSFPYLARTTTLHPVPLVHPTQLISPFPKNRLKYKSPHATDLSFAKDETIRVTGPSPDDEDWLIGETLDGSKSGGFPKDFIVKIEGGEDDPITSEPAAPSVIQQDEPAQPELPPVPAVEPAPPSPKLQPAPLPASTPSAAPTPTPAAKEAPPPAPPAQLGDAESPSKQSMKDRLAFFAAAQNKAAPPPPLKPKPAAGGLTWSQRQKLRQEQEEKERAEREARGEDPAAPAGATPAFVQAVASAPVEEEKREGGGMSAADAASSITAGGSLKERMAALRAGGAFGAPQEEKPAPPKPSGKVWSRPPAPQQPEVPEDEEDAGAAVPESSNQEGEQSPAQQENDVEETEETEEEKEKARRAAIAARMAKIGARGPMGAAPTTLPKPVRKPTQEIVSSPPEEDSAAPSLPPQQEPSTDRSFGLEETNTAAPLPALTAPGLSPSSPPTIVPMTAIPRRAAPPRRRAPGAAAIASPAIKSPIPQDSSVERVVPTGEIEPPLQVMVAGEEDPLPKTQKDLALEKEQESVGRGPGGAEGAVAAGIALLPAVNADRTVEKDADEVIQPVVGAVGDAGSDDRGVGQVIEQDSSQIVSHDTAQNKEVETGLEEGGAEKDDILEEAAAGGLAIDSASPTGDNQLRPIETVPLQPPAPSALVGGEEGLEDPAPPPPQRGMMDLPKDEVELKHDHDASLEAQDDTPPPPPRRGSEKPLGPRALPPSGRGPLPPPPLGIALVPPRDEELEDREANGEGDEEGAEEGAEEDDAPPPPPARSSGTPPIPSARPNAPGTEYGLDEDDVPPPPPRPTQLLAAAIPPRRESPDLDVEEEDAPPPPPTRKPSLPPPVLGISKSDKQSEAPAPTSPVVSRSPVQATRAPLSPTLPSNADEAVAPADERDDEKAHRSGIAARMAKLGGIKFGMPPPTYKKRSTSGDAPALPIQETQDPGEPPITPIETTTQVERGPSVTPGSPVAAPIDDDDESPEAEAARRRATLARLRAGGALGFGMFNHGPRQGDNQIDERGPEEETPEPRSRSTHVQEEDDDDLPPPPPPIRPPVPSQRPSLPPPPQPAADEGDGGDRPDEHEDDVVPPPPPRSVSQYSAGSPVSPVRSLSGMRPPVPIGDRRLSGQQAAPVSPIRLTHARMASRDRGFTEEPTAIIASHDEEDDLPPPPPPGRPQQMPPPIETQAPPMPSTPTHQRSVSSASRYSVRSLASGGSPVTRQQSIGQGVPVPRQLYQEQSPLVGETAPQGQYIGSPAQSSGRPGYDALVNASKDSGARLARAARAMIDQGKKAYYGDGSPYGFVAVAMDNAHVARPQSGWGQLVYEQEGGSVLKRHDEPRPGDIAAFHDARLKGRKGLSGYEQHVGSVEDPLVCVVVEFESKHKHKIKALQVERGVPDEVSYRLDDLKSGRVVIYRPGI